MFLSTLARKLTKDFINLYFVEIGKYSRGMVLKATELIC